MFLLKFLLSLFAIIFVSCALAGGEPFPWQIGFQEAATPLMEQLNDFHHLLMIFCTSIVLFVFLLIVYVLFRYNAQKNPIPAKFSHNITIEIIWTVVPVIILCIIAVPSFRILKFAEEIPRSDMTIKVVGSQWYWTYSYPDHGNFEFDSNLINDKDLLPGQKRLLEVDNRIVIPENTTVKFLVTASDVLHSFAIPSFGIKIDAIPGRVNETWVRVTKKGVYYGQCSELCGTNHGFMPITVEVVSKQDFDSWIIRSKEKFASIINDFIDKKNYKFNKSLFVL